MNGIEKAPLSPHALNYGIAPEFYGNYSVDFKNYFHKFKSLKKCVHTGHFQSYGRKTRNKHIFRTGLICIKSDVEEDCQRNCGL